MPYKRQKRIQDMFAAPARPKIRAVAATPAGGGANAMGPGEAMATTAEPKSVAMSAVTGKRQSGTKSDRRIVDAAVSVARATDPPPTKRRKPGQQGIASFFGPKQ